MEEKSQVALFNEEVKRELADPAVGRALLATTFKGLTDVVMKQAILEGLIRGFTFKHFLQKDVYALPFGDTGYSLITSIDFARKRGARGGVNGTSKPVYEMAPDGKTIVSCDVTVFKKDGHPGGYTATVYFEEYFKAGRTKNGAYIKSMWELKPRTMIAKVAEMQALRKAAPEDLSGIYLAEEFDSHQVVPESRINKAPAQVEASGLKMGALKKDDKNKKGKGAAAVEAADEDAAPEGTIEA